MADIELLPCPFCGGNDLRVVSPSEAWVTCEGCDAEGPTAWAVEDAAQKWNDASTLRSRIDKLEKALEPFAEKADVIARDHPGWNHDVFQWGAEPLVFTMKALRDARAALTEAKG